MKKNSSVQGTFSRLFGKKHGNSGNSSTTSLYVTNPPWVFTQEVSSEKPKSSGQYASLSFSSELSRGETSGVADLDSLPGQVPACLPFDPRGDWKTEMRGQDMGLGVSLVLFCESCIKQPSNWETTGSIWEE